MSRFSTTVLTFWTNILNKHSHEETGSITGHNLTGDFTKGALGVHYKACSIKLHYSGSDFSTDDEILVQMERKLGFGMRWHCLGKQDELGTESETFLKTVSPGKV